MTSLVNNDEINGSAPPGGALNLDPESLNPNENYDTVSLSSRMRAEQEAITKKLIEQEVAEKIKGMMDKNTPRGA